MVPGPALAGVGHRDHGNNTAELPEAGDGPGWIWGSVGAERDVGLGRQQGSWLELPTC